MMSDLAIQVEGLGKRFRIGTNVGPGYKTLRDQVAGILAAPYRHLVHNVRRSPSGKKNERAKKGEFFWALKDVNFQVMAGEVLGIIGRNGAGKSTLLKILTRITDPTEGYVDIIGRVSSLLEVGTGFHQELTGRENVYLNGAILGMKKVEIDKKFDEIVGFAEVEKFIETPVKFYSSGMKVRLAFAVAAHLEPEILLVDEVLAVGDAAFQRKCLNKMEDVGKGGRTVLFVSHHMPSITRLCDRAILLDEGKIIKDGPAQVVVSDYLRVALETSPSREWVDLKTAPGNDIVRLRAVRAKTEKGEIVNSFDVRQPVQIEMVFEVLRPGFVLYPHFTVHNEEGVWLFSSIDTDPTWRNVPRPAGQYVSTASIPGNLLNLGTISIGPAMRTEEPFKLHFYQSEAIAFQVNESPDGDSARVDYVGRVAGVMRPYLNWNTHYYPKG